MSFLSAYLVHKAELIEMNSRGFSTDFEAHRGLLAKFARKAHDRLSRASVCIGYDDVFQEMCVTYCKAVKKYDSSYGISFTAYLGRAVWNEFNKLAKKLIRDALLCQQMPGDGVEELFYEMCENTIANPDEVIESEQHAQNVRKASDSLSPMARFFINQLIAPSDPVLRYMDALSCKAEIAKQLGYKSECRAVHKLTLSVINKVYEGVTVKIKDQDFTVEMGMAHHARKELNRVYGLTVSGSV